MLFLFAFSPIVFGGSGLLLLRLRFRLLSLFVRLGTGLWLLRFRCLFRSACILSGLGALRPFVIAGYCARGSIAVLAGSASYIAAPAAVRLALPQANPAYYLTASLGLTFPFNLVAGIPLYYVIAQSLA